jgi:hypothetical protein
MQLFVGAVDGWWQPGGGTPAVDAGKDARIGAILRPISVPVVELSRVND